MKSRLKLSNLFVSHKKGNVKQEHTATKSPLTVRRSSNTGNDNNKRKYGRKNYIMGNFIICRRTLHITSEYLCNRKNED